jgi:hypothetical protein
MITELVAPIGLLILAALLWGAPFVAAIWSTKGVHRALTRRGATGLLSGSIATATGFVVAGVSLAIGVVIMIFAFLVL